MYLKKFIYINWGNVPNTELDFGPINLFSGGNGSGKTTAADAIQTVMTAAHDNLFHFNPGQDESSQRGRGGKLVRTLASYVLGCDDGAYSRPQGCDAYLAAVFYPTPGENAAPFTALIGMRAFLETTGQGAGLQKVARLDDLQFFILNDVSLALKDLLKEEKSHKYVVPLDRALTSLRRQFSGAQVEKYDKKKSYLCRLYGILRGKKEAVAEREAMSAARAFSRFMAYKPIKGIDEFVANEILEYRDLGEAIRTVSAMLKRIHTMEADARIIRQGLERMVAGRQLADNFIAGWLEQQVLQYSLARRRYMDSQNLYLEAKHKQQVLRETAAANQQLLHACDNQREELNQQILAATARRLGIPALRNKDELERESVQQERQLREYAEQLRAQHEQLSRNRDAAKQLLDSLRQLSLTLDASVLKEQGFIDLLKDIGSERNQPDINELLNQDWLGDRNLDKALAALVAVQKSHNTCAGRMVEREGRNGTMSANLRDQLAQELDRRRQQADRLKKQIEIKRKEINALEARQINYPPYVRAALEILAESCPKADARVLCDYVEITEPEWQAAIEGYLGAARFGIIVDEAYEADAISCLRQASGAGSRARVIQGEKARKDFQKIASDTENSACDIMRFSHATAEAYVKASYGNVQRVADAKALKNTRRGITMDAMGSGNYAMFRCDIPDADLVFGLAARERALAAKQQEFHQLVGEFQVSSSQAEQVSDLIHLVDQFKSLGYAEAMRGMCDAQQRLHTLKQSIAQLDLADTQQIELELTQLNERLRQLNQHHAQLSNQQVDCRAELKIADTHCQKLDAEQNKTLAAVDQCEANLQAIATFWPDFDADVRLQQADEQIPQCSAAYFEGQLAGVSGEVKSGLHKLQQAVLVHNQFAATADAILFDVDYSDDFSDRNFRQVCDVRRQLDALFNRDKNHILAQRHSEIESLRESFNNAFVSNLCHSIYQAINEGKKILEDLNRELEHHRFGADRERFRFDWEWVPEYKEYWQFFKAVIDNPGADENETLFTMRLDEKHQRVRTRLMSMLLDEDEEKALRELTRIADYRNYRRYEIYKEPEGKAPIALSQYGTGSGGQLETPAYIIRSAAITSAFRFTEGDCHLRMVLVDEAFSKMDEHRSREVIKYLTESLGLQLLFIMPSSKSGPFMEVISNQFVFSKCPTAEPVGELKTRVLLDRQVCDQEKISELMAHHRSVIRQQATLDFLLEVETVN